MGAPGLDGLTKKRRRLGDALLAGKSKKEAGKIAYPKSKHPKIMTSQTLADPRVKSYIADKLDKAGLTPEARAGEYKRLALDSMIGDEPNDAVRLRALDQIDGLIGDKAPGKSIVAHISDKSFIEQLKEDAAKE